MAQELALLIRLKDEASSGLREVISQLGSSGSAAVGASSNFGQFSSMMQDAGFKTKDFASGLAAVNTPLMMATAGFVALGAAVFATAMNFSNAAQELQNMSMITGFSINTLRQMEYVAKASGVSIGMVDNAMMQLAHSLGNIHSPGNDAASALRTLGVSLYELKNMSPEDMFFRLGQAISQLDDPIRRLQVVRDLFGRGGAQLLPLFGADFEARMFQAGRVVSPISDADIEKANQMNVAMANLGASWSNLMQALAVAAFPGLTSLIDLITRLVRLMNELGSNAMLGMLIGGGTGMILGGPGGALIGAAAGAGIGKLWDLLPKFAGWEGAIPGPTGQPYLATVHGGEIISQPGRGAGGSVNVNIYNSGSVVTSQDLMTQIRREVLWAKSRNFNAGLA